MKTQKYPIFTFQDNIANSGEKVEAYKAQSNSYYVETCPFCKQECHLILEETSAGIPSEQYDKIAICKICGWWSYSCYQVDLNSDLYFLSAKAILKKFQINALDVPCDELSKYIEKNPGKLKDIHPIKFEQLVADIYKEVNSCYVESCSYGRPDKGIDIICLLNEKNERLAIQVKRYKNPIELGQIHQFLGAMIDNNFKKGTFLTTSNFRRGCFELAERIITMNNIEIDLVDGNRFLEFLKVYNSKRESVINCPYWHSLGYKYNSNDEGIVKI